MNKKEQFKNFAKSKPELLAYVKDGSMTWQKFFEIYDIYGEDESIWSEYPKKSVTVNNKPGKPTLNDISNIAKKVDMNSVQKHINTAQKAINLFKEFGTKGSENIASTIGKGLNGPLSPRPLGKFFED